MICTQKITIFLVMSIFIIIYIILQFPEKNYNIINDEFENYQLHKDKIIFFEFEDNLNNNFFTICGNQCNSISTSKKINFSHLELGKTIEFNEKNIEWIEIPLKNHTIQNLNGTSVSFWVKVHTHEKKHNMIYNKGSVGWGSNYLKSINGFYAGDLKQFQALWTGNNQNEYLNVHCNNGEEIKLNYWYFIVHVLEKDQTTLRQYINGKEFCYAKSLVPINFHTDNNLFLGRVIGTYNDTSNLTLDDFIIYNQALTKNNIKKSFIEGLDYHKNNLYDRTS